MSRGIDSTAGELTGARCQLRHFSAEFIQQIRSSWSEQYDSNGYEEFA